MKRFFDIVLSLVGLVVLLPLFGVIALAIRLSGTGPVIFRQARAGREGRPFVFYKFRTMRPDAEPFDPSPKTAGDARLTRLGRFLREHSLDELPQLFNVLKGDMSIVGPRPLYVSQMAEWNERQKKRLLVRPGLTGLAQISGRGELTREEKLALDVKYVEDRTGWLDIKIIAATFTRLFTRKGIYEKRYSRSEYNRGEENGR